MNPELKPRIIAQSSTAELRSLIKGGTKVPVADVVAAAKWAMRRELDEREQGELLEIVEDLEGDVADLEEQIETMEKEHASEIDALKKEHERAMIAATITL